MNKALILSEARTVLLAKQADLFIILEDLNEGLSNDTKSSAGDKYETSRAMSQQEIDKIMVQIQEIKRQLALIPSLEALSDSTTIQNGSFVSTSMGDFFIGLPIGQLHLAGTTVFCVSATSPLAQQLLGLTVGSSFNMQQQSHLVKTIH